MKLDVRSSAVWGAFAASVILVTALTNVHCGSQEIPEQTAGPAADFTRQFANPGADVRPRLRWWWPGAHVDQAELVREIHEIADAGFGGVGTLGPSQDRPA